MSVALCYRVNSAAMKFSDSFLLFVTISICLIYFRRVIRRMARFLYLTSKLRSCSISDYVKIYMNFLSNGNTLDTLSELAENHDYKPVCGWFGCTYALVVSDAEDLSEVFKNKYTNHKPVGVYKVISDIIGDGILTLSGTAHKKCRKIFFPAFRKSSVEPHLPLFNAESEALVKSLREKADGMSVNVFSLVCDCLCKMSVGAFSSGEYSDPAMIDALKITEDAMKESHMKISNPLYYWCVHKLKKSTRRTESRIWTAISNFKRVLLEKRSYALRQRKQTESKHLTNFFNMMLDTEEENGFTDEECFGNTYNILTAATDTVLSTMGASLLVLALNQDVQQRLYEEIVAVFGKSNRRVEACDLSSMVYMDMVIKEVLRLYPAGATTMREVEEETRVGELLLPKGILLVLNFFALHRNPKLFKDPLVFNPDRFSPEMSKNYHPYSYIPFGHGPRSCPGQIQAMFVIKTMLCHIFRSFKVLPGDALKSMSDIKLDFHMLLYVRETPLRFVCRE